MCVCVCVCALIAMMSAGYVKQLLSVHSSLSLCNANKETKSLLSAPNCEIIHEKSKR